MSKYGYDNLDQKSYEMGIIGCFSEMVSVRLKKLALSTPILKEDLEIVEKATKQLTEGYNIKYYIEDNLIENNIEDKNYTKEKYVFLIYKDANTLQEYLKLKDEEVKAKKDGIYTDELRSKITVKLCNLLSYPQSVIEEKYLK